MGKISLILMVLFMAAPAWADETPWPECWNYPGQCHGDSDNSGDVKAPDFICLNSSWYRTYPDIAYNSCCDYNRDGKISAPDFLILKAYWYKAVPQDCPPGGPWPPLHPDE